MKRILTGVLAALCSVAAMAATTFPLQLLSPTGSTAGQAAVSTGPTTPPTWGNVTATALAAQAANTVVANITASSASPTAVAIPTCNTSTSALQYTPVTGWTCYASSASLTGATFTGAITAPGVTTSANFLGSGNGYSIGNTTGLSSGGAIQIFDATHGNNVSVLVGGSQVANFTSTGITNAPISGSSGSFTTLAASSTVSGTGFSNYFASPPAIGTTAAAAGKFTTLQATSTITPSSTAGIVGTTAADNANAGSVGEYITATGTSVALTSATGANITSVSLTAGDWDVGGVIVFQPAGATTLTVQAVGPSTTSATLGAAGSYTNLPGISASAGNGASLPTPAQRFNVSTTTTVFLVGFGTFSGGTCNATGTIWARRRR